MFCDKKKCDKCGLGVKLTLQNKETNEIKETFGCIMMENYLEMRKLNQTMEDLRKDTQMRGNEIIKGMGHSILTNLKKVG